MPGIAGALGPVRVPARSRALAAGPELVGVGSRLRAELGDDGRLVPGAFFYHRLLSPFVAGSCSECLLLARGHHLSPDHRSRRHAVR